MVRMRLMRVGAKNDPRYRIVVADARAPRDGRFIEILGHYHPTRQPEVVHINRERALHWLSVGAQPSETVVRLLSKLGIWQEFRRQKKQKAPTQ
ncbi:30S ribosomal protein S16 [bacterium HR17]|uniref:Small ribosomal subunit protein bS16 n=1 Tax=Candidatus Fervidibacter japonicus TaxID=2035412 RepID=A0A2H5X8Y1_9BACT|nr:30S ribosomal protein S16 [bacterium HR17]